MNDYVIGHIRTWVPIAIGWALTMLARELGIVIDETTEAHIIAGAVGLVSGVYYALVRAIAEKWPWAGNLIGPGVNKAPAYFEQ